MNILDPLPDHKILSLLLTLQCTAECLHCGTNSSPRVKHRLDVAQARDLIQQAHDNDYKLVVFTGGEPLLYGHDLFELVRYAQSLGLFSRLVTNAYWANSAGSAAKIIAKLGASGLGEINFSTGDQHARFVPVENILYAAKAALLAQLPVSIMVETVYENTVNRASITRMPRFLETFDETERELIHFCESPWMPLDENVLLDYPDGLTANRSNIDQRVGCDSIINTTTVLADGRIMACCGLGTQTIPELHVGQVGLDSLRGLNATLEDDFLKRWIKIEGPERILAWAAEKDPSIRWENMYAHRCQACKRLYSDERVKQVITEFHEEKILDVLTKEWLLYHYKQDGYVNAEA